MITTSSIRFIGRSVGICALVAHAGLALAQTPPPVAAAAAPEQPKLNVVATLYADTCASCHGETMAGGRGPTLLDHAWIHGGSDADIAHSIREGWLSAGMPPFKAAFDEQKIRSMVIYIREMQAKARNGELSRTALPPPFPDQIVSEKQTFRVETVAEGLDMPWGMVFLPDGRILVTERPGNLRIIDHGKVGAPITGVPPVWEKQDGGMFDVALHPDYAKNGWIYLAFSEPDFVAKKPGASTTRVIRGRIRDGVWVDQQTLFQAPPELYWDDNTHFGIRFLFDKKGHLFYSLGDRGHLDTPQDLSSPYGKLHRVMDDGSIPADNPFVNTPGAVKSIWTYGNRNQQGLSFDPVTGNLWATEHGPRGGDELNLIIKGHNYGWPVITYGMNYDGTPITDLTAKEGMDQPVAYWTPSIATGAITFYSGKRYPKWKNNLFLGALAGQQLLRIEIKHNKVVHQEVLFRGYGRVRDVVVGPDGLLYVALNNPNKEPAKIVRLVPIN